MLHKSYLNINNIKRSNEGVEYHPLLPFLPDNAKILFLGSFPPQKKRWCVDFYYPNFINDHWRIEGEIFFGDKEYFVDKENKKFKINDIIDHCNNKGIAFFDTSYAIKRLKDNASDKFLEVVEVPDIRKLIAPLNQLKALITTGEKATETICNYFCVDTVPKVNTSIMLDNGIELYRLPSSSRAYPLAFSKKVEAYRVMFEKYGLTICL